MNSLIIVAAGSGKRMGTSIPKQFIEINGKTILEHTLSTFEEFKLFDEIILVLAKNKIADCNNLEEQYTNLKICEGGKERFHSVRNALNIVNKNCKNVFIHDAVRPFVTKDLVQRCLDSCAEKSCAIPAIQIKDSLRMLKTNLKGEKCTSGNSIAVNRESFRNVQTPQAFRYNKIVEAYADPLADKIAFTDDATVYEESGYPVFLVEGDPLNIKITTPEDLDIAKLRLTKPNA